MNERGATKSASATQRSAASATVSAASSAPNESQSEHDVPTLRPVPGQSRPDTNINRTVGTLTQNKNKNGDREDDSGRHFMSEPSVSEGGDSSSFIRAPHSSRGHHIMSPSQQHLTRQSPAPSSPGNTSLSSWDSPATMQDKRFHFQFPAPVERERNIQSHPRSHLRIERTASGQATVSLAPTGGNNNNNGVARMPILDHFGNDPHNQQQKGAEEANAPPSLPATSGTAKRNASSSSTDPVTDGQIDRMGDFLQGLRLQSDGVLEESSKVFPTNDSIRDATGPLINSMIRKYNENIKSNAPTWARNENITVNETTSRDVDRTMGDHYHRHEGIRPPLSPNHKDGQPSTVDDSVLYALSDSDPEEQDDEQAHRGETNDPFQGPLDWETQHHSGSVVADDEKTPEQSPRVRAVAHAKSAHNNRPTSGGGKGAHRRSRSGDDVAASMVTGTEWKGMEQDNIPLPEDDDDEEEEEESTARHFIRGKRQQQQQQQRPVQNEERPEMLMMRNAARNRPGDNSPLIQQGPLSERPPMPVSSYGTLPPAAHRQQDHVDSRQSWILRMAQLSPMQQRPSVLYSETPGSNPVYSPSSSGTPFDESSSDDSNATTSSSGDGYEYRYTNDDDGDGHALLHNHRLDSDVQLPEVESQYENKAFHGPYQRVVRPLTARQFSETDSPFANIGKHHTERARRAEFLPTASVIDDDPKSRFQTYVCPNCLTRQRAFFSVSDAPRKLQEPSGYLAFYFTVYVIASLFIFGLEEGWLPLDCIYFAVITLTTAGLGDFVPTSDANKIICSIFIYFGVACIGLLLGSYIAGMLDDKAYRSAKQKQVQSCPNCARIKTIREAAIGRRRIPKSPAAARPHLKKYQSERNVSLPSVNSYNRRRRSYSASSRRSFASNFTSSERTRSRQFDLTDTPEAESKDFDSSLNNHNRSSSLDQGSERTKSPVSANQNPKPTKQNLDQGSERTKSSVSTNQNPKSSTQNSGQGSERRKSPVSSNQNPKSTMMQNSEPTASSGGGILHLETIDTFGRLKFTPANVPSPSNTLGSPMTRQIRKRQSRTRHISFDVSDSSGIRMVPSTGRPRGYSAELHQPSWQTPTISEASPLEPNSERTIQDDGDESSDFDGDESNVSSSSSSSVQLIIDEKGSSVRAAKYVFLTLRQALVNSMVIIAVGCFGFWLIESFSFVDSWYFTTVLLTTVGYGDIVPVTRGGKLFATIYILVAGSVLLNNMSMISMIPLELRKRRIERAVLTQFGDQLDDDALRELASGPLIQRLHLSGNRPDGLNECTREMFALAMLVRLGKVNEHDIRETFASFQRLDVNNEGVLNSKSIIAGMIQRRRSAHFARHPPPPPPPPDSAVPEKEDEYRIDDGDFVEEGESSSRLAPTTVQPPTPTQVSFGNVTDQELEQMEMYWFQNAESSQSVETFQPDYHLTEKFPTEQCNLLHQQSPHQRQQGRHRGKVSFEGVPK